MSALDQVVSAVEALVEQVEQAHTSAETAIGEADDNISAATSYGANDAIEAATALKNELEKVLQQSGALVAATRDVQTLAAGIVNGT